MASRQKQVFRKKVETKDQSREIARLNRQIAELEVRLADAEKLAYVDSLTGMKNRRFFDTQLAHEVAAMARKEGGVFSIAVCDVDDFKLINASYGHPGGDAVLRELGVLLPKACRTQDWPARIGGEEFGIILPDTDAYGAAVFMWRICELVRMHHFTPQDGRCVRVTLSMGLAEYRAGEDSPASMYARADEALLRAKSAGKNTVVAA